MHLKVVLFYYLFNAVKSKIMRYLEINKSAVKVKLHTQIVASVNMKCTLLTDMFLFYNIN